MIATRMEEPRPDYNPRGLSKPANYTTPFFGISEFSGSLRGIIQFGERTACRFRDTLGEPSRAGKRRPR